MQRLLEPVFCVFSYSLEGLTGNSSEVTKEPPHTMESVLQSTRDPRRTPVVGTDERGSLVSLTEEEMESDHSEGSVFDNSVNRIGMQTAGSHDQSSGNWALIHVSWTVTWFTAIGMCCL